jgi:1,4-dihydroxy-2-naphthoate octaprenyltransferase
LFFVLGIVSIVAAIKYTVGDLAYGYSGFGDVFVFLFFGLLSVLGSYFLFTKEIYFLLTLPAISIGLLSTAVLNLNNMRDYQNDKKSKKNTIVVKIGLKAAKRYHYSLLLLSFISAVSYVVLTYTKTVQFIFLLAYIPLVIHALFVYNNKEELRLDAELKKVALSTFLFSVFLGLGQVL